MKSVPTILRRIGLTYFQLLELFPTERAVIEYFIKSRYGHKIKCNHCGSTKVYQRKARPRFFCCNGCGNSFSIFKGTIFEKTTNDLRKWTYAIHLVLNAKKSISGCQLHRELGGSYKTSWRMLRMIRQAMGAPANQELFQSVVEIDETYVGGKPRKGADAKPTFKTKSGAGTKRTPVVGIVERETGRVSAKVTPPTKWGRLTSSRLFSIIDEVVRADAVHMTDALMAYRVLGYHGRIHLSIDHSTGYVNGDVHTNGIESFWALLKRGIIGSYHNVSLKYLQDYVNEFSWRFNNRANKEIFHDYMKRTVLAA